MNITSSGKKKLTWLLILQGWTMLWVVIGHSPLKPPTSGAGLDMFWHQLASALFNFAYSFHMPLFIMISGYLFNMTRIEKNWKYPATIKEKWIRLGIPYIVFITFAIILKIFMPDAANRHVDTSSFGFIMNYIDPFNGALQEMWFIAVIFWYFLMYPVYPALLKTRWSYIAGLCIAGILFFIPIELLTGWFSINRAVHFFIFFYLGLGISRFRLDSQISKIGFISLSFVLFIIGYITDIKLLTPAFGSLAFWGLAIQIDKLFTNNLFSTFRNYTYQIFLIGIFAQIAVKFLSSKIHFTGSYPVWWFICVFAGIFIPVLISKSAEKTNNKYIKMIFGL